MKPLVMDSGPRPAAASRPGRLWRTSLALLTATCWISATIFALFILAQYGGAVAVGRMDEWNDTLPRLHVAGSALSNASIGLHFALGALLLLLGPVQLIGAVRERWPVVHRTIGWLYAPAALLTGLGGCAFILMRGTVGGPGMSIGFFIYGALTILCAVQTVRFALRRALERHRAWAIRLFALAIGSWLYRMDYGFWTAFMGRAGHTATFDGPFDQIMYVWFYAPNLLVAELAIRGRCTTAGRGLRAAGSVAFLMASLFIAIGTFFFTWKGWGPVILWRLGLA